MKVNERMNIGIEERGSSKITSQFLASLLVSHSF